MGSLHGNVCHQSQKCSLLVGLYYVGGKSNANRVRILGHCESTLNHISFIRISDTSFFIRLIRHRQKALGIEIVSPPPPAADGPVHPCRFPIFLRPTDNLGKGKYLPKYVYALM